MSGISGLGARLAVIALLAVGLVGMHHLVVAACHHAAGHPALATVLPTDFMQGHVGHSEPPDVPADSPHPAPGGLIGAAATCLAILLMIVGLALPQVLVRLRRWQALRLSSAVPQICSRIPRPPDLALLSVSRT